MESSQSSSSSSGTWASGRKLSNSQRERKRAIDRKRVSKRREQNADRIATLESKLAEVTAERDSLKRSMASMSRTLNHEPDAQAVPHGLLPTEMLYETWEETSLDHPYVFPEISLPPRSMNLASSFDSTAGGNNGVTPASVGQPMLPIETPRSQLASEVPSLNPSIQGSTRPNSSDRAQAPDCQRILGRSVRKARMLTPNDVCTDTALNDDALIRGIMTGWADVEERYGRPICPLWSAIKALDMRIFGQAGSMTRLPCLKMIHLLLLCLVKATSVRDLPLWYRPVKVQYQCEHPFAADLLPWPALRERAVLSHALTQTNKFWTELVYQFHLGFPAKSTVHDAVSFDESTNRWSFTGLFFHHLYEIREWHVDPEFFVNWPETYDDIVPPPDIGRSLPLLDSAASAPLLNGYPWQTVVTAGPGTGAGMIRDKAQHRQHRVSLPLPVRREVGKLLDSDDDEMEESWHRLPWHSQESVPAPLPMSRSGFMPVRFTQ